MHLSTRERKLIVGALESRAKVLEEAAPELVDEYNELIDRMNNSRDF
jgi:hypothetical protein